MCRVGVKRSNLLLTNPYVMIDKNDKDGYNDQSRKGKPPLMSDQVFSRTKNTRVKFLEIKETGSKV